MKNLFIIDGYNFIFHFYRPDLLKGYDLEILREKFISDLSDYFHGFSGKVIVVFDSSKNIGSIRHSKKVKGIEVVFSGSKKSADTIIEEIAHNKQGFDRKYVVTSDNIQQTVVFKENIYRKSIREFSLELASQKQQAKMSIKDINKMSSAGFLSIGKRIKKKNL